MINGDVCMSSDNMTSQNSTILKRKVSSVARCLSNRGSISICGRTDD